MAAPSRRMSAWREGQRPPGGHRQLHLDQVDAGDHLGDGVLDLQAGVHLEEVEALVAVDEELDGAGAGVADARRRRDRRRAHRLPGLLADEGRGRLLDDLLVAALDGALPLEQVHGVAVVVGQHLDLDVPRVGDVPLGVHRVVAEARPGLRTGAREGLAPTRTPRARRACPSPASRRGFEHDRVADGRDQRPGLLGIGQRRGARYQWHSGCLHPPAGLDLVAHGLHGLGRRPDEGQTLLGTAPSEACSSRSGSRSPGGWRRPRP